MSRIVITAVCAAATLALGAALTFSAARWYSVHYIDVYLATVKKLRRRNRLVVFLFHALCEAAASVDGFFFDLASGLRRPKRRVTRLRAASPTSVAVTDTYPDGTTVERYPAPAGAPLCGTFTVSVNGKPVDVYDARVRLHEEHRIGFAYFDFAGAVEVTVVSTRAPVRSAVVRPLSAGVVPAIDETTVRFTLAKPANLSIEVNGSRDDLCLLLFANPQGPPAPDPADPTTVFFGPGIHDLGKSGLRLASGQTVYIAGGAIVRGPIRSLGARDIGIVGRGILDGSLIAHERVAKRTKLLEPRFGRNLHLEGIILRDSPHCGIFFGKFDGVVVRNVKNVSWFYNADGINPVASRNVLIERCFVRTEDDAIAIKAAFFGCRGDVADVTVRDSVFWNEDAGNGLEIGYENSARSMRAIRFENVDLVHCRCGNALSIHHADSAILQDVTFENVRIEDASDSSPECRCAAMVYVAVLDSKYSIDPERGSVRGITFRNVSWSGDLASYVGGLDERHRVDDVTFERCVRNGKPVTCAEAAKLDIGANAGNVRFA